MLALVVLILPATAVPAQNHLQAQRSEIVERGLQYLVSIQKEGALGEERPTAVTSLFVLACLSSGVLPDHSTYGPAVQSAYRWILENSSRSFLGGAGEPNEDHALAALALSELIGTAPQETENLRLYQKNLEALAYSLDIQSQGTNPDYEGGWRPSDRTRVNDRVLSAWFLLQLRSNQLRGAKVPKSNVERALEFETAGQLGADALKEDERGGFPVGAAGLPVRDVTAAGMASLALLDPDPARLDLARGWLARHPPHWYGPHFFPAHFFAARALYRTRDRDGGKTFEVYFARLVRLLRERQEADGSIPFPPGHGAPIMAMGHGYSTALALLILNVDRGYLPLDQ